MKSVFFLLLMLIGLFSCKAQIGYVNEQVLPLREYVDYIDAGNGVPEGTTYIKDTFNDLDEYVGTWKGTWDGKDYEVEIIKTNEISYGIREDLLKMYYRVKQGNIILENTLGLPENEASNGRLLGKEAGYYVLDYTGPRANCGESGEFLISVHPGSPKRIHLTLAPDTESRSADCNEEFSEYNFPVQGHVVLLKQ